MELQPRPPAWALWAGLPAPDPAEDFSTYVTRLGLDSESLLTGLTPNTLPIANRRLATELMRKLPWFYEGYVEAKRRTRSTF